MNSSPLAPIKPAVLKKQHCFNSLNSTERKTRVKGLSPTLHTARTPRRLLPIQTKGSQTRAARPTTPNPDKNPLHPNQGRTKLDASQTTTAIPFRLSKLHQDAIRLPQLEIPRGFISKPTRESAVKRNPLPATPQRQNPCRPNFRLHSTHTDSQRRSPPNAH